MPPGSAILFFSSLLFTVTDRQTLVTSQRYTAPHLMMYLLILLAILRVAPAAALVDQLEGLAYDWFIQTFIGTERLPGFLPAKRFWHEVIVSLLIKFLTVLVLEIWKYWGLPVFNTLTVLCTRGLERVLRLIAS
jgi:hypothetical protein